MKKLLLLLIAAGSISPAIAQEAKTNYLTDDLMSRWVIDADLLGGFSSQKFTTANSTPNYPNALNMNTGQLKYTNGYSLGADAQLGFFFGEKRHFGVGGGFLYMQQQGFASLGNYHSEYQATDAAGNIFRQVVNGNNITENITSSSMNIPIMLKYKDRFSKHWGFAIDAGALVNVQMKNAYTTNASFDYEAVYKLVPSSDGGTVSVYDKSPTPSVYDWLITKAEFLRNNPNGNVQNYFSSLRALGYSVGDGLTPNTRTGNTSYSQGSVGFMIKPSFNYFFSDNVALNLGVYYMLQPFKNNAQSGYRLTDGIGNYSSVLNNVTASTNQDYGLNLGVRFFLGRKRTPLVISSTFQNPPSQCGLCDGSISLAGLSPNQPVTVDYSVNGVAAATYATTVQPDGGVKVPNLCAGAYTGIVASIKRQSASGQNVILADPAMTISAENTTNPTLAGSCDGSVIFKGLYAGKSVIINYNLNGISQNAFAGIVDSDRSITISNLCEGKYTGIVAATGSCTANASDFTLAALIPPAITTTTVATTTSTEKSTSLTYSGNNIDISTPILFDFNMSVIHRSFLPELRRAAKEMKEDKTKTITIDGYTDIIGTADYNQALSVRRANAVKTCLVNMGVNPNRISAVGHGAKSPAASNNTTEGRQEDRRAIMK